VYNILRKYICTHLTLKQNTYCICHKFPDKSILGNLECKHTHSAVSRNVVSLWKQNTLTGK